MLKHLNKIVNYNYLYLINLSNTDKVTTTNSINTNDDLHDFFNFRFNKKNLKYNFNHPLSSNLNLIINDKFNIFYLNLSNTMSEFSYKYNSFYKNLFITEVGKHLPPYLNIKRFLYTWSNAHKLLYNLFFSQAKFLSFASKVFLKESQSFN